MSRSLIFFGTTNLDIVFYSTALPVAGESLLGRIEEFGGGKGANQAVAAARLGANPEFATFLGQDDTAEKLKGILADYGVQSGKLRQIPGAATGKALIFVGADGSNMIGIDAGRQHAFRTRRCGAGAGRRTAGCSDGLGNGPADRGLPRSLRT